MESTDQAAVEEGRPATPPLPPARTIAVPPRLPKSPGLALALSALFPGIGQIYNGQVAKALVFFFGLTGSVFFTVEVSPLPFAFLIPFVYFFNVVDAYRSATLMNVRFAGGTLAEEEDAAESPAWGATLIGLGLLLLVHNLGWLDLAALHRYWPLVLVAVGAFLLRDSFRRRQGAGNDRNP